MTPHDAHVLNEGMQRAYQVTLGSPDGKIVVADLVAFCFGRKSAFDPDPHVRARNEGRREVLLRIMEFCNLSLDEIYALRGVTIRQQTGESQ